MDLPIWGIAVIALYSLLQIPAVLLLARYCEVEPGDLPTPPMRSFWQDETRGSDDRSGPVNTDGVRCRHCGAANDPSFGRCRNCVAQL